MLFIKVYTRDEVKNYSKSLAGSIHMAYSLDGKKFIPLNQNYGMLFAASEVAADNTIVPCYIKNPECFIKESEGVYMITGKYITFTEGSDISGAINLSRVNDESERTYAWITTDFCDFTEIGFIHPEETDNLKPVADNIFTIDSALSKNIIDKWIPLTAMKVELKGINKPARVADLDELKAVITYSDGSIDDKKVDWFIKNEEVDAEGNFVTGKHDITGIIHKDNLPFPLTKGYADPVLFKWEGSWYFISTNDNLDDIGIYVRRADCVENLFNGKAIEACILPYAPERGFVQTFWAPEFHVIGGELYILFAVGGHQWAPQCHMMKLKKGGDILKAEDWEEPVKVLKADGTFLGEGGITLDMTHFCVKDKHYLAWSYREGIGTPLDTGSMIYLATTNPAKPWVLTSEPMLLTRPLYGWENTEGTINNEGPYALIADGKVYLAYSGGSANGYSYVVGMMIADTDADLMDIANWKKTPCPMLSSCSVGIDGPGHNSFYISDEGKVMIAYHGQLDMRCSAIHRVHFNKNGFPLLNMSLERDIPENLRNVTVSFDN